MTYQLEVIAFNIESCMIAERTGAHRVELCDSPGEGGTTPSYGLLCAARKAYHKELYPMIRPRGGDFLYSDAEVAIIRTDIALCKNLGCEGIVTGLLLQDGKVDKDRLEMICELAYPLGVTFHRAFDRTSAPFEALETIIACGCERILTSGQKPTVLEGKDLIKELIDKAADRIIIMPGSGVRSNNIMEIARATAANEFHSSARSKLKSRMTFKNLSMNETLESSGLDEQEIWSMISQLKKLND